MQDHICGMKDLADEQALSAGTLECASSIITMQTVWGSEVKQERAERAGVPLGLGLKPLRDEEVSEL